MRSDRIWFASEYDGTDPNQQPQSLWKYRRPHAMVSQSGSVMCPCSVGICAVLAIRGLCRLVGDRDRTPAVNQQ